MNLLLASLEEVQNDRLVVDGRRAQHVREVLRAQVGDTIRVGLLRSSVGEAKILELSSERLVLGEMRLEDAAPAPGLCLIIALPRPKALRRLLQTAASFGIDHIDLVNAWRVDKSYWGSPALEPAALREELWLGCEQGRHVWMPSIAIHRLLVPFLNGFDGRGRPCLLAQPGSENWLGRTALDARGTVIAIGPEGGWIADELASFGGAGFLPVAISRSILRSEIALAAALAQWELLSRMQESSG